MKAEKFWPRPTGSTIVNRTRPGGIAVNSGACRLEPVDSLVPTLLADAEDQRGLLAEVNHRRHREIGRRDGCESLIGGCAIRKLAWENLELTETHEARGFLGSLPAVPAVRPLGIEPVVLFVDRLDLGHQAGGAFGPGLGQILPELRDGLGVPPWPWPHGLRQAS